MPLIVRDLAAGSGEWPGPGNEGVVSWASLLRIPRTTRIRLHRIAWYATPPAAGPVVQRVTLYWRPPAIVTPSHLLVLADSIVGTSTDPTRYDGSGSVLWDCCQLVPRLSSGAYWDLCCESDGLAVDVDSSLLLDWTLEPRPDSGPHDGGVP